MKEEKMSYNLSEEESKRINILKTISIIFVVYIHAYAVEVGFAGEVNSLGLPLWLNLFEDFISKVISGFAVPMYFFLSAVLLFKSERKYIPTMKNKVKTLVVPYLFWNTVGVLIFIILQSLSFTAPFFSGASTPILESSFREWLSMYGIGPEYPKVYPLWFLRDLIVVTAVYPVVKAITDKLPVISLVCGVILVIKPGIIPFQTAAAWFMIGAYIVKMNQRMKQLDSLPVVLCVLIYIIASIVSLVAKIEILNRVYLIIGVLFWLRMSKEIYNHSLTYSWVKKISPWIFVIYAFHEPAMTALKKLCLKILPTTPVYLFLEYIMIPIVIIGVCICVGYLFKKMMPQLYRIATGER